MNNLTHLKILKKKYVDIVLLCLFLLPTFMLMNYNIIGNQIIKSNQDRKISIINTTQEELSMSNGYQVVDPINITTGSDWALYPFITGNGSESNPYIIENVEIIGDGVKTMESGNDTLLDTSYVGIYINAGGSFIIRNCKISHTSIGIHLYIGLSPGVYPISNVEISDCSIGIYSKWFHIDVNISNCYIHDCNWVSIKAKLDLTYFLDYGGVGMWIRSDGGIIEDCRIEDCSIGMVAGLVQVNRYNEFINCGFVPDWVYMYITDYDNTNTVNGKPIGIFWGIDNWVFNNASLYGQLIFATCDNLTLSNIHFTEPCSIPIQLFSLGDNQTTYLKNIVCENQKLGFFIYGQNMIGDNLYAKNCEAGFYFESLENSEFTRIMTDNTDIPIYMTSQTKNFTIEIEKSTKIYLVDWNAWYGDKLHIVPGDDISMSYITELGMPGYTIQINTFGTYQLNLTIPAPSFSQTLFTVISVPRYPRPDISPEITINSPTSSQTIGITAPSYDLSITTLYDSIWYSLDGGVTNLTASSLTGTINQAAWVALADGIITITFFANNSVGMEGSAQVMVIKDSSEETPPVSPGIPGYNLIALIGVTLAITLLLAKKKLKK